MTEMSVEHDVDTIEHLDAEWDVACEVQARAAAIGGGTPRCLGDPAQWVAWRANCCPESPRYMLICDVCKNVYDAWIAANAFITCGDCGTQTGGFVAYTELNKART